MWGVQCFRIMKKVVVALVSLLYITASAGVTMHMHYCMGQLANKGIGHNTEGNCGKCGMEKRDGIDMGCCMDEYKFIKNNIDQKTTENGYQPIPSVALPAPKAVAEISLTDFSSINRIRHLRPNELRSMDVAVYILNCVFLI
jgi:hypothetical protein